MSKEISGISHKKQSLGWRIRKDLVSNWSLYLMLLPPLLYLIIFHYTPMGGLVIGFQNYNFRKGILHSPWIGIANFRQFFSSMYFSRTLRNTLILSAYGFLFSVPAAIILALLLNEVRSSLFKRSVQTISYLPYFISMVVAVGILADFCKSNGLLTQTINFLTGGRNTNLMGQAKFFRGLFIGSNIWQHVGYNSIIYMSALAGIDQASTIIVLLILRVGEVMSLDYEKVLLMYTPATYSTADIIQTYVYRVGLVNGNYSYATAVGLFNSVVSIILIVLANRASRRLTETSLW